MLDLWLDPPKDVITFLKKSTKLDFDEESEEDDAPFESFLRKSFHETNHDDTKSALAENERYAVNTEEEVELSKVSYRFVADRE